MRQISPTVAAPPQNDSTRQRARPAPSSADAAAAGIPDMIPDDRRLTRHLATVVIAKLAILAVLWFVFFHHPGGPARTPAAAEDTAAHVLGPAARQGALP